MGLHVRWVVRGDVAPVTGHTLWGHCKNTGSVDGKGEGGEEEGMDGKTEEGRREGRMRVEGRVEGRWREGGR